MEKKYGRKKDGTTSKYTLYCRIKKWTSFGYTQADVDAGLVFKHLVPCVEYEDMVDELREQFITHKCACYQHGVINKDGVKIQVVSFFTIQNKLLNGHRVLEVGVAEITDIIEKRAAECCCEE